MTILVNKNLVISQKTRACYQAARVEQLTVVNRIILYICTCRVSEFLCCRMKWAIRPPPHPQASEGELYIQGVERQRRGPLNKMHEDCREVAIRCITEGNIK
jgi:hypothetical protein